MTQQIPSTEPELAGVRNFRDVGGLPTVDGRRVRHGVLFRSGHLAHATPEDAAFLDSLGLHTIFDFRNAADQKLEGPDVERLIYARGAQSLNASLHMARHSGEALVPSTGISVENVINPEAPVG